MKSNGIWGVIAIFSFYTNGSKFESLNKDNGCVYMAIYKHSAKWSNRYCATININGGGICSFERTFHYTYGANCKCE